MAITSAPILIHIKFLIQIGSTLRRPNTVSSTLKSRSREMQNTMLSSRTSDRPLSTHIINQLLSKQIINSAGPVTRTPILSTVPI